MVSTIPRAVIGFTKHDAASLKYKKYKRGVESI
jgi:hypothetical protein